MRRVMIATPTHSGQVDIWYAHSVFEAAKLCTKNNIDLFLAGMAYDSIIQNARNDLVALAVNNGLDDMIWIDADQQFQPEWIPTILSYPVDCVGAAVRKKVDHAELYNVRARGGPLSFQQHPSAPILTTPDMALGCGFLRLSRRAFTALWNSSERYNVWGKGQEARWIFDIRPHLQPGADVAELVGEDTIMSDKLRALGIETWVDPNMTCPHIGVKKYEGDFAKFLAGARAEALAQQPARGNGHDLPQAVPAQ